MRVVRQKHNIQKNVAYAVLAAGLTSGVWAEDAEAKQEAKPQKQEEQRLN
jgi:hypothetical protein